MKTIKFLLSILFFLFSSVDGFSQIIEDTNICTTIGSSASFTVVTSEPSPTSFVWQYKSPTSSSWTTINSSMGDVYSGYNTATLNITKSSGLPVTGTLYMVEVNAGSNNLISNEATLTIDPKPVSKLITGASAVCAGGSKTLTYGAGSVGEILWQYSTTSSTSDFYDLDLETERTYVATDLQDTTWFQVMNTSGVCAPSYSPAVQVVVNPLPVAGNIDGGDINVCSGSNTTTLTLYNHEGAIQWQKALDVAGSPGTPGTFANITSAILPDYSATNLTATTYFRAVLSSGVCTSVTTFDPNDPITLDNLVAIIVDPKPVSKLISGATPACIGGSKVLVYGTGSVGDIQWQSSTISKSEGFEDIENKTVEVYTATDLQETTWFRVMNTSGEVCDPASSYSPAVQVIVNQSTAAGKIEVGNSIVSKKSDETELTLKDYTGAIQWQKAASLTGVFTNIPLSTSSTYITTGLTETTYFRTLVSNGDCSAVASDPVVVNVASEFKALAYPNPFETEFNINLTPQSTDPIELKIYDMLGRLIENHYVKPSENNSMRMGTTYPPGFFTVLIKQGLQERNVKVLKK